jgi:SAM-dependent methyltransferase
MNPSFPNPWLSVPLSDYEGHMSSPAVRQLAALSALFGRALEYCRPASVAVLGVAGGNGLERIDCRVTRHVVGVDIHAEYLDAVRNRFAALQGLELHCADLARDEACISPVSLAHAALLFEHAGTAGALEQAVRAVAPGGHLSVVLQLPGMEQPEIGATPFPAIQNLKEHFTLIDPARFKRLLEARGFSLAEQDCRIVPGGKALWLGVFARID